LAPDQDGYPHNFELERIKGWDLQKEGVEGLLDLIESCWHWSDCCFKKRNGLTQFLRKKCWKMECHTGGWSGNEDIIRALQEQDMFWLLYWVKSERGGHYWFEVPKPKQGVGSRGKRPTPKEVKC